MLLIETSDRRIRRESSVTTSHHYTTEGAQSDKNRQYRECINKRIARSEGRKLSCLARSAISLALALHED